ncbi:MAG: IreB family regulatory phosphoprotein [Clostridia bacterium]|nr:IreB family regulatory phosphoprotein [Clostridia bacterium]
MDFGETMKIKLGNSKSIEVSDVIKQVYEALKVKGYDPISQIVGYILSGDPTYITSYNGARNLIVKIERDELLEELTKSYLEKL